MYKFIILCFAICVVCEEKPINDLYASIDHLFTKAWEYQALVNGLQNDINQVVINIQGTVSDVLTMSTNQTLTQFEKLKNSCKKMEEPIRIKLSTLNKSTECYELQEANLKFATNTTVGYQSSICASAYDKIVNEEVQKTQAGISKNSNFSFDVQQVVVRSFLSINAYMHGPKIEKAMQRQYDQAKENCNVTKAEVNEIIDNFKTTIKKANENLGRCHTDLLNLVTPYYTALSGGIDACAKFIEDSKDSGTDSKVPELPKAMLNFIHKFPAFKFDWMKNV